MGQVLRTNGDYNIYTGDGATIRLDTGTNVGTVRITGNLVVEGETLNVTAENLIVQDNIIVLNDGETGDGVTKEYAGIQIDRGFVGADPNGARNLPASLLFDEARDTWIFAKGTKVTGFNYSDSKLQTKEIRTDNNVDNGDLILIGSGTGVIKVGNRFPSTGYNYDYYVTDDNDVPNKKYVDDAIRLNPTFQITKENSRVIVFDKESPLEPTAFPIGPYVINPTNSQIAFIVDNRRVAIMTQRTFEMRGLTIFPEDPDGPDILASPYSQAVTIQATNTNTNIRLETNGTGKVEITYAMQFNPVAVAPAAVSNTSVMYAGSVGGGTSGLYAVNTNYRDELVLKNRALLFSMIF